MSSSLTYDYRSRLEEALALQKEGEAYIAKNEALAGIGCYRSAIDLYRQLETINPGIYLSNIAELLHIVGTTYRNNELFEDAHTAYRESLSIKQGLANEFPDIYNLPLARNLHSLARLYMRMEDYWQAGITLQSTVNLLEGINIERNGELGMELVTAYNNVGIVQQKNKDHRGARTAWEKSLPLLERLTNANPVRYANDWLQTLENIATIDARYGQFDKAQQRYNQQIAIKDKYKDAMPDKYEIDMAGILRHKATIDIQQGDFTAAETNLRQSISWYQLTDLAIPLAKSGLITSLKRLEFIYNEMLRANSTINVLSKLSNTYKDLNELEPGVHEGKMADTFTNIASEYAENNMVAESMLAFQQANEIYNTMAMERPEYLQIIADNHFWLAILSAQSKDLESAETNYKKSIEIYESLVNENQPDLYIKYANVLIYFSKLLTDKGSTQLSSTYKEKAEMILKRWRKEEMPEAVVLLKKATNNFTAL